MCDTCCSKDPRDVVLEVAEALVALAELTSEADELPPSQYVGTLLYMLSSQLLPAAKVINQYRIPAS